MKYDLIDPALFVENRKALLAKLPSDCIAVFHSADIPWRSADGYLRFFQNADLFWLTGVDQEQTMLILEPGAAKAEDQIQLFVRETSEEIAIWEGEKLTLEQARATTGIQNVRWNDQFMPQFRRAMRRQNRVFLNHNEHARTGAPIFYTPDDRFRSEVIDLYPNHRIERVAPFMHALRQVKSQVEIDLIKRACDITGKGFRRTLDFIQPGVMEYEIEAELAHEFIRNASRGFAYEPIVATGINACCLHYHALDTRCEEGELVLMDVAAEYAGYNSDLTRTVPVSGKFTDRQRAVYDAVHRIFLKCREELMVPGKSVKEVYQREVARACEDELIELGLVQEKVVTEERKKDVKELPEEKRAYRKYFMHGTSHSMGIDVHDVGPPDLVFLENQVMTIEPGIYIREEGFGIRLENDVVVRAEGNLDLMADIPMDADEIESIMAEARK